MYSYLRIDWLDIDKVFGNPRLVGGADDDTDADVVVCTAQDIPAVEGWFWFVEHADIDLLDSCPQSRCRCRIADVFATGWIIDARVGDTLTGSGFTSALMGDTTTVDHQDAVLICRSGQDRTPG